ncbi:AAA family ATPase [uncultured Leptotrichia sp.]|uniref:AAA family ATPase n=1 Tax=uncultured Leptotrichia sp. TaxID=159271 RepID=UPI0025FD42BE|nr:AAA family ATPase [uncultured Leptotrichia sp.]
MKKKKKGLAIGNSDFKEIIQENGYYVDKTKFIEDLLEDLSKVKLFTRPRRFGKTLNLSMIKYFFDVRNAEENRKLFDNLYISKSEYMENQGQNPVILISLRNAEAENWEDSFFNIKNLISNLYDNFEYISINLKKRDLVEFENIWLKKNNADWENSLKNLSRYLYEYYGKKVIILIDEYDTPMTSAWNEGYYEKSRRFFKSFYSNTLKDNEYLQFAVVTGILRVAKEGIFSGLNNLKTYTVLNNKYAESFGLIETEVKNALEYYGLEQNIEKVRKWYNGYKFGNIQIYNPWSIINYLDEKEINVYWINTSDNRLIHSAIENADKDLFDELKDLFNNGTTEQMVMASSNMDRLKDPQEVWQLLLFGGYLTVEEKIAMNEYALKLPNYEVKTFFKDMFVQNLGGFSRFREMIKAFKNFEFDRFEELLNEIFLVSMSYHDTSKTEKPYHTFILGMMLYLDNEYTVLSNNETGYGRNDLALNPINKRDVGYIFEFKVAKTEEELEERADEALSQIENKKYPVLLKECGVKEIVNIGMAFFGKRVKVKYKVVKN